MDGPFIENIRCLGGNTSGSSREGRMFICCWPTLPPELIGRQCSYRCMSARLFLMQVKDKKGVV